MQGPSSGWRPFFPWFYLRCHFIIMSSRFMDETVKVMFNGLLVRPICRYLNVYVELWATSRMRRVIEESCFVVWNGTSFSYLAVGFDGGGYWTHQKTSMYCTPPDWFSCHQFYPSGGLMVELRPFSLLGTQSNHCHSSHKLPHATY